MSPSSRELIAAITDFYKLVTKLPYISPTALVHPSDQGWPDINAEELRKRGKTEEVISLLRHLPYLRRPGSGKSRKGWMIGPDTHAIAYCDGEVYEEELDRIQPTPGHCIWVANAADAEHGTALLLDVENSGFLFDDEENERVNLSDLSLGTITEYSVRSNRNVCLETDEYHSLPLEDRWMAHSTLPATEFFRTWTNKYKKLEWMPLLKEEGELGTSIWFINPTQNENVFDDNYSEDSDESYEPSSEESDDDDYDSDDYDSEDDPYEYDSEYESDDLDDVPLEHDALESNVQELKIDDDESTKLSSTTERLEHEVRSEDGKILAADKPALERAVNVRDFARL